MIHFSLFSELNWYFFIDKAHDKPNKKAKRKYKNVNRRKGLLQSPGNPLLSVNDYVFPVHGVPSWKEHL